MIDPANGRVVPVAMACGCVWPSVEDNYPCGKGARSHAEAWASSSDAIELAKSMGFSEGFKVYP